MEAAIRWSPHSCPDRQQFLIVDVQANRLQLCQIEGLTSKIVTYKKLSKRDRLPNYTAFDWSKTQPYLVALGAQSGEANLVRIDPDRHDDARVSFPIRYPRKCNSIAFSTKDFLATGLDRVRNDHCMNIYDLQGNNSAGLRSTEPFRKLASSEPISSIKFFVNQPDTLVCGVTRQCIRLFDIRDNNSSGAHFFTTRQVHNLAIDPLDENYFISAGPAGEPIVSVWDRRMASKSSPSTPSSESGPAGAVLEMKPAVENSNNANIWALRYSGTKRGCFGVLSSTGEFKVVETSRHSATTTLNTPINNFGGNFWASKDYIKRIHHLTYPWYDAENGRGEHSRVIGYDFVSAGILSDDIGILALRPNRDVELMKVPNVPRKLCFTAKDELYIDNFLLQPSHPRILGGNPVAVDLASLQEEAKNSENVVRSTEQAKLKTEDRLGKLSMENFGHKAPPSYETPLLASSGDKHEQHLMMWFPEYVPKIGDALDILRTQRRRCFEGYQLNPQKNKEIVSNDPWLVDMWDTIKRFDDLAKDKGMTAAGLDLSYLGIYSIWNNTLGMSRNRNIDGSPLGEARFISAVTSIVNDKDYPSFQGHKTKYPAHRQLCLAMCGWTFSKERQRVFCERLMDNKEYYKAVVIAVMRGFKDLAQELLRSAIQQKALSNIGLGAVIACESVNSEQRELCEWMAEETDDPYLKALLNYFIKGDWKIVADMPQLALSDRVGVALKYLDDKRLDEFIKIRTKEAMLIGNIEGLVLTGLSDQSITLFSNYIRKFNDLQTAVLAMSFTCPLYLDDFRFDMWKETYKLQMQTWRAFHERTKYLEAHAQTSKTHDGRLFGTVDERPATLRCPHCLNPLAQRTMQNAPDGSVVTSSASTREYTHGVLAKNGQICAYCGHKMPVCGICSLPLASPDPRRLNSATSKKLEEEDSIARQAVRCSTCGHTFHGHHARDWFARHKTCPELDCNCMCASLH
ncbi:uncharacterized protein PV09_02810 [Verruconis gallopava]|uniref:Uncharacterized protein n=1 Tax=Verruconis gallopava TaxID=253628 RepID=A0A0D2AHE6_9PEZI|nr:uncharacterized protein PV09_02810 [Verruconis gallopava]KIW06348.1 hypothetical protein PV09_02810 [Verruconis gallopava]